MNGQIYAAVFIHLVGLCIASDDWKIWSFDENGNVSARYEPFGDFSWPDMASNIDIAAMDNCNSSKSCVDLTIVDNQWIIEQTSLQNMKEFDELSEFLLWVYVNDSAANSSNQCTVSHKFDTQSTYQIMEPWNSTHWTNVMIPINHSATKFYVKLEGQGCSWKGNLNKFVPDGQCENDDDQDECIYIIGMDDDGSDYVQEWHQHGCSETFPVYVREFNDSNDEYLCRNYDWYVSDVNCAEFDPIENYPRENPHELGACRVGHVYDGDTDIFTCSGRPREGLERYEYDGVLRFYDEDDRYSTKLIVECSEIDLFPPVSPSDDDEYASSICVQLEIPSSNNRPWGIDYYRLRHTGYRWQYASTFMKMTNYSKNGKPIYLYNKTEYDESVMYYVFSDGDRWIISTETIRLEGTRTWGYEEIERSKLAIVCDEDNLMDCTQNKWSINGMTIDRIKVFAGDCGVDGLEWDEDEDEKNKWILPVIICGSIGAFCGIYFWRKRNKRR